MYEHLGVRSRAELVPALLEHRTERQEIIDLPVKGDPYRSVFIAERLLSTAHINNAEARVHETDAIGHMHTGSIGTPVR
jgi:hypothetical protein